MLSGQCNGMFVGSDIHAFVMHDSTPKFPIFSGRDIYLPISRIQKINTGRKEFKKKKEEEALFLIQVVLLKLRMYIEPSKTVF